MGELLDVGWLAERRRASGIASAIEVMEDEDKVWLAKEVYDRLDVPICWCTDLLAHNTWCNKWCILFSYCH